MASLSVTIVNQKEVLFQGSYGYHDRENKIPLTQDSLFAIGSLTKVDILLQVCSSYKFIPCVYIGSLHPTPEGQNILILSL